MLKHFKNLPLWYHVTIIGILLAGLGLGVLYGNNYRIVCAIVFSVMAYWVVPFDYFKFGDGQYYSAKLKDQPLWVWIGIFTAIVFTIINIGFLFL